MKRSLGGSRKTGEVVYIMEDANMLSKQQSCIFLAYPYFNVGTTAIHLALWQLGVGEGDTDAAESLRSE
ncbi:hypothetical protein DT065_03975 [Salicibibacter kimchii]|uniref:Uncharacterized protein n=1 Tax=Salicibibacter kimchii TaxID=2099786 RepID=A0A345BWC8_9BACI|nr:hypothetical protein DT065_03975 [Salicibibacter kimchii]